MVCPAVHTSAQRQRSPQVSRALSAHQGIFLRPSVEGWFCERIFGQDHFLSRYHPNIFTDTLDSTFLAITLFLAQPDANTQIVRGVFLERQRTRRYLSYRYTRKRRGV